MRTAPLLFIALVGCTRLQGPDRATADPIDAAVVTPVAMPIPQKPTTRCLPVVAAECHCVYSCAIGTLRASGQYLVRHPFWKDPVPAKLDRYCVDAACTDAFFGEIVCDGICSPRPADATCHFEGERCVGSDAGP